MNQTVGWHYRTASSKPYNTNLKLLCFIWTNSTYKTFGRSISWNPYIVIEKGLWILCTSNDESTMLFTEEILWITRTCLWLSPVMIFSKTDWMHIVESINSYVCKTSVCEDIISQWLRNLHSRHLYSYIESA